MVAVSLVDAVPDTDAVVIATRAGSGTAVPDAAAAPVDAQLGGQLGAALKALGATGKLDEVVRIPTLGMARFPLVVATGLGPDDSDVPADERARRAVGAALRSLGGKASVHVAIDAPVAALAEGALYGSYRFTTYRSKPGSALRKITIGAAGNAANRAALRRAKVLADALHTVRDLVNTPPNDLYPETFAARLAQLASGLEVEVLDQRALARGKYGGILAVGAGSARPPRLVRVRYRANRPRARVALVGKGVTYDSGGLNLKPAPSLTWAKSDMAGGAAVVAAVVAAAALRLSVDVTATVPIVENMPGYSSYRPSDILTLRNGTTVEVVDTDAEGRLILADAIARALEDDPEYLIEASTLTAAQIVALGTKMAGAMGEPEFRDRVTALANAAGEATWAMPLLSDLRPGLDSPVADLANLPGDRWGSMIVGGTFLSEFIPDGLPWVHLDVVGPAWNPSGPWGYTPKGATGAPVRTLIAALEDLAAG
jgi:leucyl aminopeptidase